MTRRFALAGSIFALALAGCQEQITQPDLAPDGAALSASSEIALDRGAIALPAGIRISDQTFVDYLDTVINPGDYECPATPSPINVFYLDAADDIIDNEPEVFDILYNQLLADLIPTYEALYFATDDTPQYFGYDGEFTKAITKTERDIKRFWDIQSSDIQVIGMHGSVLTDVSRTAPTYELLFGLPPALAEYYANIVRETVLASETVNGGDHPLFSFNAFAFTTYGGPIPDKIVMGDGILEGYAALGFGDVAPQAIFAHEFAHHIQYENDYFSDPIIDGLSEPEQTRYTELMADAFAAYYLTHKRGATMNQKRVEQFLEVFYQIGDCGFANGGHHGTPNQRLAAAQFGFDIADQAQKQGHILSSEAFHALFVAEYPNLIAPDAP